MAAPRRTFTAALAVAALLALPPLAPATAASARVPQGFVGAMVDGPMFSPYVNLGGQLGKMVAAGVENARIVFNWKAMQPVHRWREMPRWAYGRFTNTTTGVPTDFNDSDRIVAAAAAHGITLMPVVVGTPSWAGDDHGRHVQPAHDSDYADFLTVLVQRYGPGGTYWYDHPFDASLPIRTWQIWNEPSGGFYWDTFPFAPSYVALLKAAHDAIRAQDPGAKIVLAGFANTSWQYVEDVYRVQGASKLFDYVAVHPYTAQPQGVITILSRVRAVMRRYGDARKPIIASEVGWPASKGLGHPALSFATDAEGEAQRLSVLIPLLGRYRRSLGLAGFDLYTWMGTEHKGNYAFDFSGLVGFGTYNHKIYDKPSLSVFTRAVLALEQCRVKGPLATSCRRRG